MKFGFLTLISKNRDVFNQLKGGLVSQNVKKRQLYIR